MTGRPLEYSPLPVSPDKPLVVALAGNPNSGKTTIFNALTGLRQKVANYPGVTVEKKTGRCKLVDGKWLDVIDLPGTYSLISRSPDEHVAMEVLRGLRDDTPPPDVVIVVVDASNLQRNLYLVSQLIELGRPMVLALNMTDVAERRGIFVDAHALAKELGVPVIPVVAHKRKGIDELKAAVAKAAIAPLPAWPVSDAMREEMLLLAGGLAVVESEQQAAAAARATDPESASTSLASSPTSLSPVNPQRYEAIAERLLIGDHASDVAPLLSRPGVDALLKSSFERLKVRGVDPMQADIEAHYKWIDGLSSRVTRARGSFARTDGTFAETADEVPPGDTLHYATPVSNTSERVDAVLIHKVWGLMIFAAVMATLFVSIFWLAGPIMDATEGLVISVGDWVTGYMAEGALKDLVKDGIFAGVGGVVIFVPQIAMLFLFLAILEDSGYLARAAFLMDRLLGKVGLSGKAFIPLLSSFACAIPGIMATRTIENRRDRLATIFVAPFMSCSARLPVYTLLIGTFFAGYGALAQGGIMLACYVLGVVAAAFTAFLFKRTFLKGPAQAFILELPTYKVPQASQVARVVWSNTAKFLTRAGTIIFCLSIILWAMNYYPRLPGFDSGDYAKEWRVKTVTQRSQDIAKFEAAFSQQSNVWSPPVLSDKAKAAVRIESDSLLSLDEKLEKLQQVTGFAADHVIVAQSVEAAKAAQSEYSISGRIGHFMEPAIKPLGYDWKMGVGLVAAFAAREIFVSSIAVVYSAGEIEDDDTPLREHILADRYADGSPVWTPLVAVSLLIWFVLAMQCMSTVAIVRRETGTWRWPIGMILYMNGLAYVICLIVYQVGSRIG